MEVKNVSIMQTGEALGHGFHIDTKTLETVVAAAGTNGVPVRMDHTDSLENVVGSAKNFRVDGGKVVADISLLTGSKLFQQAKELVEKLSGMFGMSIVATGIKEAINGLDYWRVGKLYAADLVSFPAANRGGLFATAALSIPNAIRVMSAPVSMAAATGEPPCWEFLDDSLRNILTEEYEERGGLRQGTFNLFNSRRVEFCKVHKLTPEVVYGRPNAPMPKVVVETPAEYQARQERIAVLVKIHDARIAGLRSQIAELEQKREAAKREPGAGWKVDRYTSDIETLEDTIKLIVRQKELDSERIKPGSVPAKQNRQSQLA